MIFVHSRRTPRAKLEKKYPEAIIVDVTSRADEPYVAFSPFFPLGNIPIPFSEGHFGQSVEGIWQGLKVFETEGIDPRRFENTQMKGLKRTVRKYGKVLGHQKGLNNPDLLNYLEARKQIYLPLYHYALTHYLGDQLKILKEKSLENDLVLLDYETNGDVENLEKPLSHAWLIKYYLEDQYPEFPPIFESSQ